AFNNVGTYNKLGNATTTMTVAYSNTGTTNVDAGRMSFTGGGSSNSAFVVAAPAVLDFAYGTFTLDAASITGAGTTEISGSSSYSFVNLNGGTMGTALLLSGGNLQGSDHTLLGPVTWTGSVIRGAASTTVAGSLAITGATDKNLGGGRVLNVVDTTWSGNTAANNNRIRFTGATINNNGTWNDANAYDAYTYSYSGSNAFNNVGTYNKLGNATTTMNVAYSNTGTTNVDAGTFTLTSAFTNEGLIRAAAGATFVGSNAAFVNAGILSGDGTIATHAGGDIVNDGGAIAPGSSGIGHLSIGGALVNAASGKLNFELASLSSFDTLAVSDGVTLGGEIGVWNLGYVPVLGDSFVVMTFAEQIGSNPFDSVGVYGFAPGTEFSVTYNLHDVTLTVSAVAAVPEPQTAALLLAGLGLLGFVAARRRAA
ncbi:MAG TPA: PEP-CTERM sorting domain-containing protein, partial [Pirellulaceae bacterium]|nr:PEP-CTERM sorting domain-containing protein [Pirellulaceae bacterium]